MRCFSRSWLQDYAIFLALAILVACASEGKPVTIFQTTPTDGIQSEPTATEGATSSVATTATSTHIGTPLPSNTPKPSQTPFPTATPQPEYVNLYYEEYAQVELIGPRGVRVLIDIANPDALSSPPTRDDILLTTHHHYDHYQENFVMTFPGQQLNRMAGQIELPGVRITGIPSAHNKGDRLIDQGGTNYIFLIEIADLRIVHFGDIGQEQLTSEQVERLLPVDIAITQLTNSYSNMNMENMKGFRLMEQVNPKLVIPTHASRSTIQYALGIWTGYGSKQPVVLISSQMLEQHLGLLLLGSHAEGLGDDFPLLDW